MSGAVYCVSTGKARYATPGLAVRQRKRETFRNGKLAIYHCRDCGGYHLGRDRNLRLLNKRKGDGFLSLEAES